MGTKTQPLPPTDPRTAAEWIELYYAQGWSEGLPLVPPTEESVQEMLAAGGPTADKILGTIDERNAHLPAEKVAINAVMAGCLPAYFPKVLEGMRGEILRRVCAIVLTHPREKALYIAGDTVGYPGVAEPLKQHQPDVIVLNSASHPKGTVLPQRSKLFTSR